jgi:hypothetical protein
MERLLTILDDWKRHMKPLDHRLHYPSRSLGMSSGGESTEDEFEHMLYKMDKENVKIVHTIIFENLPKGQKQAILAKYLNEKPPIAYEWQLDMAYDNLLTMAGRLINA